MKILITGSGGMLGSALCSVLPEDRHKITGLDVKKSFIKNRLDGFIRCDITNYNKLLKAVKGLVPDIVIHAAAFADVDGCESDPGRAESINALGTRYVAEAALATTCRFIYISTDFVFDGQKRKPYKENDEPRPINIYGRSKLDGERYVAEIMADNHIIIRSSWIFGMRGKNFVDTILDKAKTQKELRVVSDQFGSPTYSLDLADAIKKILDRLNNGIKMSGTYHITNSDNCSWYRLAQRSLELANIYGVELVPISSQELERPAQRPLMSILDNARFIKVIGRPLRPWENALEEYISLRRRRSRQDV